MKNLKNISFKKLLDILSREELEELKKVTIEEINPPYIHNWSLQAQQGHIIAFVRKAIQIETKLNGEEAGQKLKNKLRKDVPLYRALTPQEKEERSADRACLNNAIKSCYLDNRMPVPKSKWKRKSIFNYNGKENGSEGY